MPRLGGMNARDIRMLLRTVEGIHPKLMEVLTGLADRQDHLYQLLGAAAEGIDKLATLNKQTQEVMGKLAQTDRRIREAKAMGVTVDSEVVRDQDGE